MGLLIILTTLIFGAIDPTPVKLDVQVSEISGTVYIAVYDHEDKFMEDATAQHRADVKGSTVSFDLDLKPGTYAITVFQDMNANEELDTNFIGIPKEPYGFSNNVMGTFGPPSFEQSKFEVKGETTLSIDLR